MTHEKAPTLAGAIARRLREHRRENALRLDDVAGLARRYGLSWDASTVAKIERGERSATSLEELIPLSLALGVRLGDLTPEAGDLQPRPWVTLPAHDILALVSGHGLCA